MRFVWAVVAFVLAAVMIGAGIAQRTIFEGPKAETIQLDVEQEAPYTLIDGAVLNRLPGAQTLKAQADGTIFVSYGRTSDVTAWLADSSYNKISLDGGDVVSALVEPTAADAGADAPSADDAAAPDAAAPDAAAGAEPAPGRSPVGSDLWLDEFQQDDLLIAPLHLPETMSVLVAADGTAPAPQTISLSWPIANATPWAGPLIVGGSILMAIGAFLYFLGIRHVRRSRGPRRKGLPMPVTEPIDLAVEGADKGVITAGTPTRRAISGRRSLVAVPAVAISALLFTGCSADAWPSLAPSATPTPTSTIVVPEDQQQPVVTEAQAERIISRVASTVAAADEARDPDLAATRLDGAVLDERKTNYTLRGAIADYAALDPLPSKPIEIVLPQAFDAWPRTLMAVVTDAQDKSAVAMYLTQQDAWSPYKLTFLSSLEASTEMPDLAPAWIGAVQVPPDNAFLLLPPDEVAAAYADILNNGENSSSFDLFDTDSDQFRVGVATDRQRRLEEFNATGASTGSLTFGSSPGAHAPIALATVKSGAIVAVNLNETDTVKPTNPDAVIKLTNNATVKALAGVEQSQSGFTTTFSDQLFFYVPAQGSTERIRLLGYASNILSAGVIK